jgi:hypothetical protein
MPQAPLIDPDYSHWLQSLKDQIRTARPDAEFVQQAAAQMPWFHSCIIMDKVKDRPTREWFVPI